MASLLYAFSETKISHSNIAETFDTNKQAAQLEKPVCTCYVFNTSLFHSCTNLEEAFMFTQLPRSLSVMCCGHKVAQNNVTLSTYSSVRREHHGRMIC